MNIVIFGPPGAGKGTQSKFIVNKFNLYQLSTGELLRNEIPEAGALADFMRKSIASHTTVTLETMDESNLIPMFNSYCIASGAVEASNKIYPQMQVHMVLEPIV